MGCSHPTKELRRTPSPPSSGHPPANPLPASSPSERGASPWEVPGPRLWRVLAGQEARGSGGQKPCLASCPGHLLSLCVCSVGQERKQDTFRGALGDLGLGGPAAGAGSFSEELSYGLSVPRSLSYLTSRSESHGP